MYINKSSLSFYPLEIIILTEISQTEKTKSIWYHLCVKSNKRWYKWTFFTKQKQTHSPQNQNCGYQRGKLGGCDKLRDLNWHIHTAINKTCH